MSKVLLLESFLAVTTKHTYTTYIHVYVVYVV